MRFLPWQMIPSHYWYAPSWSRGRRQDGPQPICFLFLRRHQSFRNKGIMCRQEKMSASSVMRHYYNNLILLSSSRIISLRLKMIGCTRFLARKKIHFFCLFLDSGAEPPSCTDHAATGSCNYIFDEEVPPSLDGEHEALFGYGSVNDLSDAELDRGLFSRYLVDSNQCFSTDKADCSFGHQMEKISSCSAARYMRLPLLLLFLRIVHPPPA